MTHGLLIQSLEGGLRGPLSATVREQSLNQSDLPYTSRETQWGVFHRIIRLESSDEESIPITVQERVYLGPRWVAAFVITTTIIALGVAGTAAPIENAYIFRMLQAIGVIGMAICWRATLGGGILNQNDLQNPNNQIHLFGPFVGAVVPAALGVMIGGAIGMVSALIAVGIAIASGVDNPIQSRLQTVATQSHQSLPLIPTIHVAYTLLATVLLSLFLTQMIRVTVPWLEVLGASILSATIAGLSLSSYRARRDSRVTVIAAVAITAVSGALLAVSLFMRGVAITAPTDPTPAVLIGVASATTWLIALSALPTASLDIYRRFDTTGRQASTRIASVFAYLSICSSGGLLVVGGAYLVVVTTLLLRNPTGITVGSTFLAGTPLLFFIAGIGYQLTGTARNIRAYRAAQTASPLPPDTIPFEPAYPVRVVDAGGFLATAYADPTTAYIAISETTIKALDADALGALIAHEESHIHHRGAFLQVVFAIVPTVGLMGKNVILGLYDFLTREYTADQYAIARLNDVGIDGKDALTNALDTATEMKPAGAAFIGFLPTATTISSHEARTGVIARLFCLFFGHFAGGVHPSPSRRMIHISNTDDELSVEDVI